MPKLTIELTDGELAKLKALAAARTREAKGKRRYTIERCIREFARTCQPGGSGWHPPDMGVLKPIGGA